MKLPDPAQFGWDHFGRHLTTSCSSRPAHDLNAAMSRTYAHCSSDRDRLLAQLELTRAGIIQQTIEDWATKAARYEAGRRFLEDLDEHKVLGAVAVDALRAKCLTTKAKQAMPGLRLTTSMMTVIREDTPSTLVASIVPEGDPGIELRPCGNGNFARCWADLVEQPPQGTFAVIEFDKVPATVGDLVLNISIREIRLSTGIVSRQRISEAITLIGNAEWNTIAKLAALASRRLAADREIPAIDAKIDRLGASLQHDVDDVLAALPRPGSLEWRVLRMIAGIERKDGQDEAPEEEEDQ